MTEEEQPKQITFHYKISPEYKVYALHGVYGGVNAFGEIIMSCYTERGPIPRMEVFQINEKGALEEPPTEREIKDGAIRDVIAGFSLTPQSARSLAVWLNQKADDLDKMKSGE